MKKLDAAKVQAELNDFEVTITETLKMKVIITAKNQKEAQEIANIAWINGDYIIDAEHFDGVEFKAEPVARENNTKRDER